MMARGARPRQQGKTALKALVGIIKSSVALKREEYHTSLKTWEALHASLWE